MSVRKHHIIEVGNLTSDGARRVPEEIVTIHRRLFQLYSFSFSKSAARGVNDWGDFGRIVRSSAKTPTRPVHPLLHLKFSMLLGERNYAKHLRKQRRATGRKWSVYLTIDVLETIRTYYTAARAAAMDSQKLFRCSCQQGAPDEPLISTSMRRISSALAAPRESTSSSAPAGQLGGNEVTSHVLPHVERAILTTGLAASLSSLFCPHAGLRTYLAGPGCKSRSPCASFGW